ncbi:hypothetical protein ASPVEDRAFT_731859 [Aspergillus versicolor CBS 583.65]|uniref:F-box domain-containing protein n=1 Tax=Aspergillus versicolor CBS 583.65 TaxID=1036611 RepID=A0A1L9PP85_ASPVE|nr:uncharacterized protein ASPVEDRAFT_731859 [Aspergillus versicolor CBS 583.65]OJJ03338.1 hypothetical protein ASPVEDRAFT_731859 [Aspergillus versicolor CBS 583.65]
MPLEALPVEILRLICRLVGSEETQKQKARCLLVCKWWYTTTEPILYEDLVLSANHLLQMPDSAAKKLVQYARHVQIYTDSRLDWPCSSPEYLLGERFRMLLSPEPGALASAPAPTQLKSFILRTHTPYDSGRLLNPRYRCLPKWSPIALVDSLAVSSLEHLVLDTRDLRFKGGKHVCPCVARKMPSLRSLRLRMRRICPRVLDMQQTHPSSITSTSRIESIIINLSLVEPGHTYGRFSRHCTRVMSTYGLFNEMIRVASEMAKQTPSLRQVRILRHKNPTASVLAHDCVTGNRTVLLGDQQWDWGDHGKPFNSEIHEIICDRETASISSMDDFVDHGGD